MDGAYMNVVRTRKYALNKSDRTLSMIKRLNKVHCRIPTILYQCIHESLSKRADTSKRICPTSGTRPNTRKGKSIVRLKNKPREHMIQAKIRNCIGHNLCTRCVKLSFPLMVGRWVKYLVWLMDVIAHLM